MLRLEKLIYNIYKYYILFFGLTLEEMLEEMEEWYTITEE